MSAQPEAAQVDLTNCDSEPIRVPGAIQPHGVLLALREPDLTVTQTSANVGEHLGTRIDDVIGAPLSALIPPQSVGAVQSALDVGSWEEVNPLRIEAGGRAFARRATGFDRVMVYRFDEDGHARSTPRTRTKSSSRTWVCTTRPPTSLGRLVSSTSRIGCASFPTPGTHPHRWCRRFGPTTARRSI
ncbi:MAG: hypothetical protein ACREPM_04545 [Gemmatimonadaceae bacterium]